jgi:hypothetical protein
LAHRRSHRRKGASLRQESKFGSEATETPSSQSGGGGGGDVAHALGDLRGTPRNHGETSPDGAGVVGNTEAQRAVPKKLKGRSHGTVEAGYDTVGNTNISGLEGHLADPQCSHKLSPWPPCPEERDKWAAILAVHPELGPAIEPPLRRVAHGISPRVDRLSALGNAVVPAQGALAIVMLMERFEEEGA